jgi:hypothetical protein
VHRGKGSEQVGLGKTVNMSSGGVLFTTESPLPEGDRVELAVCWPAQLNQMLPLKLVAQGLLVRSYETQAAILIERYEFKTRGSNLYGGARVLRETRARSRVCGHAPAYSGLFFGGETARIRVIPEHWTRLGDSAARLLRGAGLLYRGSVHCFPGFGLVGVVGLL